MAKIPPLLNPKIYFRMGVDPLRKVIHARRLSKNPNLRGLSEYPPGHFYSPLLDIESLAPDADCMPFDGKENWEHIELRPDRQRSYYEDLIENFDLPRFPRLKSSPFRYFWENEMFVFSDAFTLSGVIAKERPKRIIEIGSGFSSAVMADTLNHNRAEAALTLIEPFPNRLQSLLSSDDLATAQLFAQPVQTVDITLFEELEAQDILFIDSSHVAKIGSDLAFILLRVLPGLRCGVLVHFHDIFYPFSYPMEWMQAGRAWNESVCLRAFLIGNPNFEIVAFNSYAGHTFPEIFRGRLNQFLENTGGSLWLRKRA